MRKLLVQNMPNAYKEVYEILNYVGEWERDAIPNDFYNLLESNMNKEYQYMFDYTKEFSEQNMLRETKAILGYIYLNYWADLKEKEIIQKKLENDLIEEENKKREKYNSINLFKEIKKENVENSNTEKNETKISMIKQSIVMKILNKIKDFFEKIMKNIFHK